MTTAIAPPGWHHALPVSASVLIGLAMALCTAVVGLLGMLLKQRGAEQAAAVEWRRPVRSSIALLSSHTYAIGMAVAMGGWGFHVAALALAPISLVQSVIAAGLVLLTPMADRLFDHPVTRREWIGVALAAAGLALLAATLGDGAHSAHAEYGNGTLALYVGALCGLGIAAIVAVLGDTPRAGVALGLSAGLVWGASDVTIKALSGHLESDGWGVMVHPLALVILILSLAGVVVSGRSFQLGPAVAVIAVTTVTVNVVTIAAGPIVFGEPLPDSGPMLVLRLLAFGLIVGGAALTPGPRVEPDEPEPDVAPAPAPA
jgi:drug/metabolite transporter (DMT)-like permease